MQRFPQYLSSPIQVLWFEPDDLGIIMLFFMVGSIFKGVFWIFLVIGPLAYVKVKARYPKSFLKHMLYLSGIKTLKGYPDYYVNRFNE